MWVGAIAVTCVPTRLFFDPKCHLQNYVAHSWQHYSAYSLGITELAGFTEASRKLALDRFHQIQPYLEENLSLRSAAGIPYRTAQR